MKTDSMDWYQYLKTQGLMVTNSHRVVSAKFVHLKTGEVGVEHLPQHCWDDDLCRSGCEAVWAKEGFQLAEAATSFKG